MSVAASEPRTAVPGQTACASFVFEATQACNHACLHCYNVWKNAAPYPSGQLDTRQTLAVLERILTESGARLVTVSGGEPLLRPDLEEILAWLAERGVVVNLVSNGSLLEERAIAALLPHSIACFELPLLSSERAIHDQMSGAAGAFDQVTAAIAELKHRDQRVVAVFVATRLNLPTLRDTLELAFALGVDGVMFNRFNPGGAGRKQIERLQASPAELERALELAQATSDEFNLPIACSIALPPCLVAIGRYPSLSFGRCACGTERAYFAVDPLGHLRPCNHSPTILGNLAEQSFADLTASAAMRDFIEARPRFCHGCPEEHSCLGGCKAAAEACLGSPWNMDPFLAAFHEQARRPAR